jgi:enamine deaminase RidA (YjgF/YER057c/UK114 family)
MNRIEDALVKNGIVLPRPNAAAGRYVPYVRSGALLFVSGQTPKREGKVVYEGHVASDRDIESGRAAAALCTLNVLAHVKTACGGDLSRVVRCIRIGGFVQSGPTFFKHSQVIDAASELLFTLFGDAGLHARTSVGVSALPGNAMVEIDAAFEVDGI